MSETGQNINSPHGDRKIGFETMKEIFMLNAMAKPLQLQGPGSRRVFNLESYEDKQTLLCAAMAVDFLNESNINFTVEKAIKSNCVIGQKVDEDDKNLYFHANFILKSESDKKSSLFFAEIQGLKRPEVVNCCIDLTNGGVTGNCKFCTGIKHPKSTDFFAKIHPIKTATCKRKKV